MIALDASAVLALAFQEPGAERVRSAITHGDGACLSTVNLAEVLGRFTRDGADATGVLRAISATAIEIVPFTIEQAALAAALVPLTRRLGLSLGDRACLALARSRGVPALTADRTWSKVDAGIEIRFIR